LVQKEGVKDKSKLMEGKIMIVKEKIFLFNLVKDNEVEGKESFSSFLFLFFFSF